VATNSSWPIRAVFFFFALVQKIIFLQPANIYIVISCFLGAIFRENFLEDHSLLKIYFNRQKVWKIIESSKPLFNLAPSVTLLSTVARRIKMKVQAAKYQLFLALKSRH